MLVLEPKLAILDETDSGLDIDALKVVSTGVNSLRDPKRAVVLVTHYQRLLDYIVPDQVHVLSGGRILKSGDRSLALELERRGYDWVTRTGRMTVPQSCRRADLRGAARPAALRSFEALWRARTRRLSAAARGCDAALSAPWVCRRLRDESWRYTNLRRLAAQSFVDAALAVANPLDVRRNFASWAKACAASVLMVNGRPDSRRRQTRRRIEITSLKDLRVPTQICSPASSSRSRMRGARFRC